MRTRSGPRSLSTWFRRPGAVHPSLASPRRAVTALAIFAALTIATVAASGFDLDHVQAGPLPDSFRMAETRMGDRGNYTWSSMWMAGDQPKLLQEHETLSFEWLAPEPTREA